MNDSAAELEPLLSLAADAARAAGAGLLRHFADRDTLTPHAKSSAGDLVSVADLEAQETIVAMIRDRRPDDGILAEEAQLDARGRSPYRWIVDPLDGTANFLMGNPQWCVSIGLQREGTRVLGAVFDPVRDELFLASLDGAPTLNGHTIRRRPPPSLEQAVIATGFSYDASERRTQAGILRELVGAVADIRRGGAAALDLAWAAAGRIDAFYEHGLRDWDAAAGQMLCAQAGLSTSTLPATESLPVGLLVCDESLRPALVALITGGDGSG